MKKLSLCFRSVCVRGTFGGENTASHIEKIQSPGKGTCVVFVSDVYAAVLCNIRWIWSLNACLLPTYSSFLFKCYWNAGGV